MAKFLRMRLVHCVMITVTTVVGGALATPTIGHAATQYMTLPDYTWNYANIKTFYALGGTDANGNYNAGVAASVQCTTGYQEKYPDWYIDASSYRIGSYPDGLGFYVRAQCEAYKFQ